MAQEQQRPVISQVLRVEFVAPVLTPGKGNRRELAWSGARSTDTIGIVELPRGIERDGVFVPWSNVAFVKRPVVS